jgi:nucleoside-diphosphate-sugar epimerase
MTETVLVTGAAGLLGAEITARLAAAGHAVVALTHSYSGGLIRNDGTEIATEEAPADLRPGSVVRVRGDVTAARLGLSARHHNDVLRCVDTIVHCAAATRFNLPRTVYEDTNIEGTRRVLDLAARSGASLLHVSTAYVCGERDGRAGEEELEVGQQFGNEYEHSKLEAERLVREATEAGLPSVVLRPSIVVGEQRTAAIREFTNIYLLIKLVAEGRLRTLPGRYDAQLDLVPIDHVAKLATRLVSRIPEATGTTVHAVGHQVTLRDFSDVISEYPAFHVPLLVPPGSFDPADLPAAERRYYRGVGDLYAPYLRRRVWFDDTAARRLGFPRPGGTPTFLRRLLDHGIRTGFFLPSPDSARLADGSKR